MSLVAERRPSEAGPLATPPREHAGTDEGRRVRVLYSFPHKLGAGRICYAAWQHVNGMAASGADVTVFPGALDRPLPANVNVRPTLSRGRARIPYRVLGRRAFALHDEIVARRLRQFGDRIDMVHTFPLGASRTLATARELGIPTVLERCNAHTEYAYTVVKEECERLGITMPRGHEHEYNESVLRQERKEYALADYLLCPSDFVMRTFLDRGFPPEKLVRFQYGFDERKCYPPGLAPSSGGGGLTVLFAAGCAPRKGLHFALQAWLRSTASGKGTFLVVGEFIPGYAEVLSRELSHPSVKILGYRKDLPDVMRASDVLVLPSIEEGSALVTYDARGCGNVLVVSDASGAVCTHMHDALVHEAGDVDTLAAHFTMLDQDRELLERLRAASLATAGQLTWAVAGAKMVDAYRSILARQP